MVHFVGAGSGAADLITVRGENSIWKSADVVIYAGSLVNPQILGLIQRMCAPFLDNMCQNDSLEDVISVRRKGRSSRENDGPTAYWRSHAISMELSVNRWIFWMKRRSLMTSFVPESVHFVELPSALNLEYTLPEISQSVIITRMEGRTPVPERESIQSFAAHHATMVIFLSTGMLEELSRRLIEGGYEAETPAAIVYKATWPDEKKFICTVGTLAQTAKENNITKTALMIIGDAVKGAKYDRSKLYDPGIYNRIQRSN